MIVRPTTNTSTSFKYCYRFAAVAWKFSLCVAVAVSILNTISITEHARNHFDEGQGQNSVTIHSRASINATASQSAQSNTKTGENTKQNAHHAPPNMEMACSCWNASATSDCCLRNFRPSHKMGHEVSHKLQIHFSKFFNTATFEHTAFEKKKIYSSKRDVPAGFRTAKTVVQKTKEAADQRDVIVTRNIYSAITSGYLYHKKGKECHLHPTLDNRPWPLTWPKVHNLHKFWEYTTLTIDPPHKEQSLCLYLANTTMADGLKVYIDWVFSVYYDPIDEWDGETGKTLHVCFEDLTSSEKHIQTLEKIQTFFFPGKGVPSYKGWRPGSKEYAGGHATSKDPNLRNEIRKTTEELDKSVFGGKLADFQNRHPCGEKSL